MTIDHQPQAEEVRNEQPDRTVEHLRQMYTIQGPLLAQVMRLLGITPDMTGVNEDLDIERYAEWMREKGAKFSMFVEVLTDRGHALYGELHGYEEKFLKGEIDLEHFQSVLERLTKTNEGIELATVH